MSHETSASDIEFAQGMLNAGCSDAEVLASLTSRGIEPAKAAELLDEVRHDRTPSRDGTEAPGRSGSHHRHRRRRVSSHAHGRLESPSKHSYRGRKYKGPSGLWWFVPVALIFIIALVYAFVEVGADRSSQPAGRDQHRLPTRLAE